MKSEWLNNRFIWYEATLEKPCKKLGYCPYGQLVEEFPLQENRDKYSCELFGHDCPVYFTAEFEPKVMKRLKKSIDRTKGSD